ncbi:MAG: ATP synthase F1 subunit gamma [Flavobacteriales bacterium]|nr:ATP synthase F1 subunit gamma [Flavobacteriales bacterium]MCW8913173.1 ATP synthase F1 subunit gamma [Flavobacteriales bacterium]MCW8937418.1 ATP synthase F1 subunit gamma [Flavobacteriales bacterium]MCW8940447.1 ATP synthase F1 subunit gamma [Flavobacteriales bacterium]MCW8968649.1 ATP synthase F1 subunit gamma [Flavobacteriales bacterium]
MANLKEIRNRIVSVNSTKQITSAMKMVSAAKLRKAQDAVVQMRPYSNKMQEIISNISAGLDSMDGAFSDQRTVENVLIVGITSNRGLCGGFNNNVIKSAIKLAETTYKDSNVTVLPIGKKFKDAVKKTSFSLSPIFKADTEKIWDDLTFENTSIIAEEIMSLFIERKVDKVVLVYNQFKNAAVQILQNEQFLPVLPPEVNETSSSNTVDYIYEPEKKAILDELIPKSLKTQLFKALLDSMASEHGARMTAMHKATDNANDLINDLKLVYNKARQASITNEILEIVAGAESLK